MNATKKEAALQGRPNINQSPANYNALKNTCKRGIILLALWGLLTPKTATAIIRALGVTNA